MIRRALLVINLEFLYQRFDHLFKEMSTVIAHQNIQATKLVSTYLKMNFAAVALVQSFTGYTSAHLVKYSILVMMYCAPLFFPGG